MAWFDLYKLWKIAAEEGDPVARKVRNRDIEGAGVGTVEAIPDLRSDGGYLNGSRTTTVQLRDSKDFIDLSSVTNRQSRYKEYERLRTVAEIETALTVFADESCVTGDTQIATPFGYFPIKQLAEEEKEDFLVYCYDFQKEDYSLGWAFKPRFVKRDKVIKIALDNGTYFTCTPDHRVLTRDGQWVMAGDLKNDDELMPFYRIEANQELTKIKRNQFARVFTLKDGWKSERQFIDEWRFGKKSERDAKISKIMRMIQGGLNPAQISKIFKKDRSDVAELMKKEGFAPAEMKVIINKYKDRRRVLYIKSAGEEDVYDLSVHGHENFATDTTIFHNCQIGENGHLFSIDCKNKDIKNELEFLFFHPKMLNMDRKLWNIAKNLYLRGDHFIELVMDPDEPKAGVLKFQNLPADSMYRVESVKGKLIEFQQSKEGPDYISLSRVEVTKATQAELAQATAIRFAPSQIVHFRIGDDRQTFYPYGVSLVEAARGPAHNLKMLEDAMLVFRISRAPERRVFYIDVGNLPPFKTEAFMERMKDTLKKKKSFSVRGGSGGASPVEERNTIMSLEEDFWVPLRQNSNTRIDTLPGASNSDAQDDAAYFRNKLFISLNFPKNYMATEDVQLSRVSLSSVDVKFARLIERLQLSLADGLTEIALRHLDLRGFPANMYEDLKIKMTPPSHWRELSENEVIQVRYDRAMSLKGSQLMSDIDILTLILKMDRDEANEMASRAVMQRLQELKMQVMAQNPQLLGIAMPGQAMQQDQMQQGQEQPPALPEPGQEPEGPPQETDVMDTYGKPQEEQSEPLPEPSPEDIKKYDLEIIDYSKGQDEEEIDVAELDD